jgi:hypothetical protein
VQRGCAWTASSCDRSRIHSRPAIERNRRRWRRGTPRTGLDLRRSLARCRPARPSPRGRPAHRQRRRCRPRPGRRAVSAADGVGGDAPIRRNGIRMAGKVHAEADAAPAASSASTVQLSPVIRRSGFASTARLKPRRRPRCPHGRNRALLHCVSDNEPSRWPLVRSLRSRGAETEPRNLRAAAHAAATDFSRSDSASICVVRIV